MQDAANSLKISSSRMDEDTDDIALALTASIAKDGQTIATADLPMGTHKHTNVGAGTARTHYTQIGQFQDGGLLYGGTAGGTANALTFNLSPAITAYATGQIFNFIAASTNTAAATVNINGVGAKAIVRLNNTALIGGEIVSGAPCEIEYDGTSFRLKTQNAVSDGTPQYLTSVSGTNTIVGTSAMSLTAYAAGQTFVFVAAGANTAAATLNVNSLGAKSIVSSAGTALAANAILSGQAVEVVYDGTSMQLVNPAISGKLLAVQVFTSTGTYTPTAGTTRAIVELVGGGGGGGGAGSTSAGQATGNGGGGAGEYQRYSWATPTTQTVTIGAAGTAGGAGGIGGDGGTSSVGTLATCPGGAKGGFSGSVTTTVAVTAGGTGGAGGSGGTVGATSLLVIAGQNGGMCAAIAASGAFVVAGDGGNSPLGLGGKGGYTATTRAGVAATGYGAGASGSVNGASQSDQSGAAGTKGICIIYEYGS